ncbi:MAG: PilT protein domain protein [Bradyrhizobium sp.]|nr:PilT protein domain protein [Bradyrhizobium sp.]
MIIDSSALIAILRREPEEQAFRDAIKLSANRLISAPTRVEAGIVALGRRGEAGLEQMEALLEGLRVETAPLSADHAKLAIDAFRRFGKGRHPAGLNFGDCFSYALAKATGEPLLFKGDDFSQTDIKRVV